MRIFAAALILPVLAACTPDAPVAVAPPPAPVPVPAGCSVDPATRLALGALAPGDLATGAVALGLNATDIGRLIAVRSGTGSAADVAYVQGCLGVTI